MNSGHSVGRKVSLMVETLYNIVNLVFSWFSVVRVFFRNAVELQLINANCVGQFLHLLREPILARRLI